MICPECEGKRLIPDGPRRLVSCPLCEGRASISDEEAIKALFKFNKRMVVWYERLVRTQEQINQFIDRVRSGVKSEKKRHDAERQKLAECDPGVGVEGSE